VKDEELRELYAGEMGRRSSASRAGCVPEDLLLAVAKGDAPITKRPAVLDHVAQCPECRAEFELLRTVTGERPAARRRVPVLALAASVAAVALGVAVWQVTRAPEQRADVPRGVRGDIALVGPPGGVPVTMPILLVWRGVPDAARYDVELLDSRGGVVLAASTTDTTLSLPDTARLSAGREYHWWVRATRYDGTQLRSLAERFRLQSRSPTLRLRGAPPPPTARPPGGRASVERDSHEGIPDRSEGRPLGGCPSLSPSSAAAAAFSTSSGGERQHSLARGAVAFGGSPPRRE